MNKINIKKNLIIFILFYGILFLIIIFTIIYNSYFLNSKNNLYNKIYSNIIYYLDNDGNTQSSLI